MQAWIPVPGSSKGRLVLLALEQFGRKGYAAVNVVDLAARAGLTTGSLYHHFGNKTGLYDVVRTEAERRLLDRMEGAAAASGERGREAARAALMVAFDTAVRQGIAGLVAEPHPERDEDPLGMLVARVSPSPGGVAARLMLACWREALAATLDGSDVPATRRALDGMLRR